MLYQYKNRQHNGHYNNSRFIIDEDGTVYKLSADHNNILGSYDVDINDLEPVAE